MSTNASKAILWNSTLAHMNKWTISSANNARRTNCAGQCAGFANNSTVSPAEYLPALRKSAPLAINLLFSGLRTSTSSAISVELALQSATEGSLMIISVTSASANPAFSSFLINTTNPNHGPLWPISTLPAPVGTNWHLSMLWDIWRYVNYAKGKENVVRNV